MTSLYKKIQKLAAAEPSTRKHLVPLLREFSAGGPPPEAALIQELRKRGVSYADIKTVFRTQKKRVDRMMGGGFSAADIADVLETYEPLNYKRASGRTARDKWDDVLVGDKVRIRIQGHPRHYVVIEELPQKGKKRLKRFEFTIGDSIMSLNRAGGKVYNYFMIENLKRDWKPSTSQTAEANAKGLQKALEKAFKDLDKDKVEYPDWVKESLTGKWMPQADEVHYLQVEPVDYTPVEIKAKDEFYLRAEWNSFQVSLNNGMTDKQLEEYAYGGDPHYTKLVSSSSAGARKFFKWVKSQEDDIKRMTGKKLQAAMDAGKIKYKYQSSVWR